MIVEIDEVEIALSDEILDQPRRLPPGTVIPLVGNAFQSYSLGSQLRDPMLPRLVAGNGLSIADIGIEQSHFVPVRDKLFCKSTGCRTNAAILHRPEKFRRNDANVHQPAAFTGDLEFQLRQMPDFHATAPISGR